MERGAESIERQDLLALEDIAQESAVLLAQIRTAWCDVEADPSLLGSEAGIERLRLLMQEGLGRSEQNQSRMAQWTEQTQESLRTTMKGSAAMAGYAGLACQEKGLVNAQV